MRDFLAIVKALGDETRLRALVSLSQRELCLCQLVELFGMAPSTISKHMNVLCEAGLVLRRKEGRWVYFRLSGRDAPPAVRQGLRWVRASLSADPQVVHDAVRLPGVLKKDLEELCACYSQG
jgi:ArsR family transcriptional regulator